ncbi:hypothetical protein T265_15565, partial [Opisthorchis viverrini]
MWYGTILLHLRKRPARLFRRNVSMRRLSWVAQHTLCSYDPFLRGMCSSIRSFSCSTLSVPNCRATRRKHECWDTARLSKPRQEVEKPGSSLNYKSSVYCVYTRIGISGTAYQLKHEAAWCGTPSSLKHHKREIKLGS